LEELVEAGREAAETAEAREAVMMVVVKRAVTKKSPTPPPTLALTLAHEGRALYLDFSVVIFFQI